MWPIQSFIRNGSFNRARAEGVRVYACSISALLGLILRHFLQLLQVSSATLVGHAISANRLDVTKKNPATSIKLAQTNGERLGTLPEVSGAATPTNLFLVTF